MGALMRAIGAGGTQIWVSVVEFAVGTGCFLAAAGAFRRGFRLIALVLLAAGIAAAVHAVVAIVTAR
ncbi:MAG: hypothetical protein M3O84_01440 [Actinomycetota bacterium]|nr:hypothetical protein [Actinomycetota bacterium]